MENASSSQATDWNKCVLCQLDSKERLISPTDKGYETVADNIIHFSELDSMPVKINLVRLDNGNGIQSTFKENNAKWHKSCYLKFGRSKLKRAIQKHKSEEDGTRAKQIFTRSSTGDGDTGGPVDSNSAQCFFCSKIERKESLREVCTFQLDYRVRKCAHDLQDQDLLAKLSSGDLIAQEAKYHPRCLTSLYNRTRGKVTQDQATSNEEACKGIALAELISYIEEKRQDEDVKVFRLADLTKLYTNRLGQLGVEVAVRINSKYLKNRILIHLPHMKAYKEGRDVFLAYEDDVGSVLREGYQTDQDEQSVMMIKLADMIRQDIFTHKTTFSGKFDHNSQVESVPRSLLSLVNVLINGSNITDQTHNTNVSQPVLSIAQLLVYNCIKRRRDCGKTPQMYHSKDRETPLPVYVGLKAHALTRERRIIDSLFALGMSASYNRTMELVTSLGNNVCDYYHQIGTVCPPQLHKGHFITSAADNIDHNPSSATSTSSFHGTSLSLFQNLAPDDIEDNDRDFSTSLAEMKGVRKMTELPILYTEIKPTRLPTSDVFVPPIGCDLTSSDNTLTKEMEKEYDWLGHVEKHCAEKHYADDDISAESSLTWAAYHASTLPAPDILPSINAMLPLFAEEASSPSMLRHCLEVIKSAVWHVNPGQTPVISIDQPLYAKLKQLQWSMPSLYGEDKFVLLMGGLHTEMTGYKVLGHWLEGSGWVEVLQEAEVATPGIAESFIKASHVTRTRHAHHITACALYILLKKAYDAYVANNSDSAQGFSSWIEHRKAESPQFMYWCTNLELELLLFTFVRSLRTGDFDLYIDTLTKLTPWFFSLNHTHYARWMSVHVRDISSLTQTHPDVAQEFQKGKFVVSKSQRKFSLIAVDHCHEQNNGVMKTEGGIIGLTQDANSLLRWAVAGPELVRVISEFEATMVGKRQCPGQINHHEQTKSAQMLFARQVNAVVNVMEEMGSPFEEENQDLLRLHSKDIMDKQSIECLTTIISKGQEQYATFVEERIRTNIKPITATITRNKVVLFNVQAKTSKKSGDKVNLLKNESSLFARLYIACQTRDGDLDNFFRHENHPFPPSLSTYGQLRQGKKSDLMTCLEQKLESPNDVTPDTEVQIMDGAVLVNFLRPEGCKTFGDYAAKIFLPYIHKAQSQAQRVDVIWDQYFDNSLKAQTRELRASGPIQRRRVGVSSPTPKNWHQFLRLNSNKTDLFKFLNDELMEKTSADKPLIVTDGANVLCSPPRDTSYIAPCNHEEADSRIMVHVGDAVMQGFHKILVRTVDTDVVVLAVSVVQQLAQTDQIELWIAFGCGKDFRHIPAHQICASLGPQRSLALPMFHAYTGCDTVSHFVQVGKKTAWKVWEAHDEFTKTFFELHNAPEEIAEGTEASLEYFTILLYDRTATCSSINEVRKNLFIHKGRQMSGLPPTKAALQQHIKRAVLQGGHHWGCITVPYRQLPSPAEWGWVGSVQWKPLWSSLPEASASCPELLKCSCRSKCRDCKCVRAHLKCTAYCTCNADCDNT